MPLCDLNLAPNCLSGNTMLYQRRRSDGAATTHHTLSTSLITWSKILSLKKIYKEGKYKYIIKFTFIRQMVFSQALLRHSTLFLY